MTSATPSFLSTSAQGVPIAVTATSGTGTSVHTTTAISGTFDEVFLQASNIDTAERILTLQIGGTANTNLLVYTIPASTTVDILVPGRFFNTTIKAISDSANKINIIGRVTTVTVS